MIAVGIVVLLYSLWSIGAAAMVDGVMASERRAAGLVNQNPSAEEIRRVFEAPPQVQVTEDWLRHTIGGGFSAWVARYITANILVSGFVGVLLIGWGVCEVISRERRRARLSAPSHLASRGS